MRRIIGVAGVACLTMLSACLRVAYEPITAMQLAQHPMRVASDSNTQLYFPADNRAGAEAALKRLRTCLQELRSQRVDLDPVDPAVVVVHDGDLNNAYVSLPTWGNPMHMVIPMHGTTEFFNFMGMGIVDFDDVSCHEAVHYVVNQETHGFWRGINAVAGNFVEPNAFLPNWFQEGLATYYESHLGKHTGRTTNPLWRGRFASGVADRSGMRASRLNGLDRETLGAGGGMYLVGSMFVEYLADTYGERKLWEMVDMQGSSILSLFAVTMRFTRVYGKSIGDLFNDFIDALDTRFPVRARPESQQIIRANVGFSARLAACPAADRFALVHDGTDTAPRMTMHDGSGHPLWSKRIADVLPGRDHVAASTQLVSGMSFAEGCRSLLVSMVDDGEAPGFVTNVWKIDAVTGDTLEHWGPLRAMGGAASPERDRYAYVQLDASTAQLAVLDLKTGASEVWGAPSNVTSLGGLSFSPDGVRLAFSGRTPTGFNLFVREPDGSFTQLTDDASVNYQPQWQDAQTLLFARGNSGRMQVHTLAMDTLALRAVSDAPYAILDPMPWQDGQTIFLSAEGWGWNVEAVRETVALEGALSGTTDTTGASPPASPPSPLESPRLDESVPYRSYQNLPLPVLRIPLVDFAFANGALAAARVELTIDGQDILGYHNYFGEFAYDVVREAPRVHGGYANTVLAPITLYGEGHYTEVPLLAEAVDPKHRSVDWAANVGVTRTFWTTRLVLGLAADTLGAGPSVGVSYSAGSRTPYGGDASHLSLATATSFMMGEGRGIADVMASVALRAPLPLSRRHFLMAQAQGRRFFGTGFGDTWLRLGVPGPPSVAADSERGQGIGARGLAYSMRGYNDVAFFTHELALVDLTYVYPIIIDRGLASLLYVVDEPFLRQIDIEVFGAFAATDPQENSGWFHGSVGAAATLRGAAFPAFPLGINLGYQVAYRVDGSKAWEHRVVGGLGD